MGGIWQIIFGLLGGLALFVFGMDMMSGCLQKAAGDRMKSILALLTGNPSMGVLAGALATAVLQSSSATTIMAIGFVGAGLMGLPQAISIILGANIGTTITAQVMAFKISDYIFLIIFAGFAVSFLGKTEKVKNIGQTIFAFGLLFLGIEIMGDVMGPLADSPFFLRMIARVADIPVLGVLAGTFMTLVVQSSSATIAVLQNFASQAQADGVTSVLGLAGAIPLLLGDNVGTTVTALLASIGQAKDARRTALAHCIFNLSGCLLFIWFIEPYAALIRWISPAGPEVEVISRQIANAHTIFNVLMALLWIPLLPFMVKIVTGIIRGGGEGQEVRLDSKLLMQPAAALQLVTEEIRLCSRQTDALLKDISGSVKTYDSHLLYAVKESSRQVREKNARITEYLTELFSAGSITEGQANEITEMMYILGELERIAGFVDEMADLLKEGFGKKEKYSKEAMKDLAKSLDLISVLYTGSMQLMAGSDTEDQKKVMKKKEKVLTSNIQMRKAHMSRVAKGKCSEKLAKPFLKILNVLDRMGNSCANISDAAGIYCALH